MRFTVRQIGEVLGTPINSDAVIQGWSIDTRTLQRGDLFFALKGPNHDGTEHIAEALARGAVQAVAGHEALERIATWARDQWGGDVVAVTGSAGKTSTKEVIATLLASRMPTGRTTGNFNNEVGLPISILRLRDDAKVAVLEIGMNHAGEIRHLCGIARPRIGVVTNVGYAHIEMFDSIEGIALAKRELIECLPPDGIAVLNNDDPRVRKFGEIHPGKTVRFGLTEGADVRAEDVEYRANATRFRVKGDTFETPLQGRHAILNILAGLAVANLYGIDSASLADVIASLKPAKMRGEKSVRNGVTILDDCYNSNPDAARAMIDLLRETPAERRVAVLGEMLELGRWSDALHREIGKYAAESGVDLLLGIKGSAAAMVEAGRQAGLPNSNAQFFDDPSDAGVQLRTMARPGDAILFKGSRGTHVEKALERFLE